MPTLSRFKERVFKVGKVAAIIISTILVIVIGIKIIFAIKEAISPTPPPPPTVSFGKLKGINFPEGIKRNLTFKIDTLSGDLPNFSDRAKVFKMASYQPDLLAVAKASEKVRTLGFNDKPEQLSEQVYRWKTNEPFEKELVLNVNFPEFYLISNYATNPAVLSAQNLPSEIEAKDLAVSFMKDLSLYPNDIDEEKTMAILYSIDQGVIEQSQSISGTHLISVFFFQKDKDGLPVLYPDGKSNMNLTVAGGDSAGQIIDARFFYQKISNKNATYPIKTSSEALDELKNGKAYISSLDTNVSEISLKKIYLAYFISKKSQDYLLPVIVFEGSNNFQAFVSGVKDDWIQN